DLADARGIRRRFDRFSDRPRSVAACSRDHSEKRIGCRDRFDLHCRGSAAHASAWQMNSLEQTSNVPAADNRRSGIRLLLSKLRSYFVFDPLIFIYTGVFGAGSLISSFFDPDGSKQHAFARAWSKAILNTTTASVEVIGAENLISPAVVAP